MKVHFKKEITMTKKFYIGERFNPQFKHSYYLKYGQLTKKEAKKEEECIYGSMILTGYETEEEYNKAAKDIFVGGFIIKNP
jgi:hypothetical protein